MKNRIFEMFKFFGISGIGWIIDFSIYSLISYFINPVISNIISSFVSITFVFLVSTKKIFVNNGKYNLKLKYFIYIIYQIILVSITSSIIGILVNVFMKSNIILISKYAKILAKIIVTPFSMICNYIVMKKLIEKI